MASTIQDELYRTLQDLSGKQTSAFGDLNGTLAGVIAEVQDIRDSFPAPVSRTQATTQPASSGGGVTAGSVATTVLESGFGLVPLITGLVSLFSGGGSAAPPPLVKYALPAAVNFQGAESDGEVRAAGYDQTGMLRSYGEAAYGGSRSAAAGAGASTSAGGSVPQITVNVQAMDARSFLDRSNDIAMAVRDAMLNLNSINDVVNEL